MNRTLDGVLLIALVLGAGRTAAAPDPLPSWNEGPAKQAILKFVADTTTPGAANFVAPEERVAVFDNDGTLWNEQPYYVQLAFVLDRVKALAPKHPEWKEQEPFKSVLAGDVKAALAGGEKAIGELVAATHAGITTDEFASLAQTWFAAAKHPKFGRLYTSCVYQPMLEVLAHLRANGFKTFIVSGGGVEFIRVFSQNVYGVPPEQVIGTTQETKLESRNGRPVLVKLPKLNLVNDGPGKPVGINRFIGRRPIFAFGNSDGDLQMLQWTAAGEGPRLMLLVHHDDDAREYAYDRQSHVGKLDKAWDEAVRRGWTVVSMKKDWKRVFAD